MTRLMTFESHLEKTCLLSHTRNKGSDQMHILILTCAIVDRCYYSLFAFFIIQIPVQFEPPHILLLNSKTVVERGIHFFFLLLL